MLRKELSVLPFGLVVLAVMLCLVSCTSRTEATHGAIEVITAHWNIYPQWMHTVAIVASSDIAIGYFDLSDDHIVVGCVYNSDKGTTLIEFPTGFVEVSKSNTDTTVIDRVSNVPKGIEDSLWYHYQKVINPKLLFDSLTVNYRGVGDSRFEMAVRRISESDVSSVRLFEDGRSQTFQLDPLLDQLLWTAVESINIDEIKGYSDENIEPRGVLDVVFYSGNESVPFYLVSRDYVSPLGIPYAILEVIYLMATDKDSQERQELFGVSCFYNHIG